MSRFHRTVSRTAPKNAHRTQRQKRAMFLETLEDRALMTVDLLGEFDWTAAGPSPLVNAQTENVPSTGAGANPVVGALHSIITHPTNADVMFVGATNGGVWRTLDATAANPTWTPRTDQFAGVSIGALAYDPTDAANNTIVAGIGRFSSFNGNGGPRTGILRSIDGGTTFSSLGSADLNNVNISAVAPRGATILVASNGGAAGGVFLSTDTGQSFTNISGLNGLLAGNVSDLTSDPGTNNRLYAGVLGVGLFRTDNLGGLWTPISTGNAALNAAVTSGNTNNIEMAVASNGRVYVGVMQQGRLAYIGYSDNQGGTWTQMDLPISLEQTVAITGATNASPIVITSNGHGLSNNDVVVISGVLGNTAANGTFTVTVVTPNTFSLNGSNGNGAYGGGGTWSLLHPLQPTDQPGSQGATHFSILADPNNPNTVYIGGDRQDSPGGFPNAIGGNDFTGRLFRGDTTIAPVNAGSNSNAFSPQWEHLTHTQNAGFVGGGTASGSAPHADSRDMAFDANGNLVEVDDGGIYFRTSPADNTGDWFSLMSDAAGGLQINEQHDIAYDSVSNIIISGNQDTGTGYQVAPGDLTWSAHPRNVAGTQFYLADGGDVAVDELVGGGNSLRYLSIQSLGNFRRITVDGGNTVTAVATPGLTLAGVGPVAQVAPQFKFVTPLAVNNVVANRLIIGGVNGAFESTDNADNITRISTQEVNGQNGGTGSTGNAIAYGGRQGGVDNPDVLYIGAGSQVLARTATTFGGLTATAALPAGAGTVTDVEMDPDDWARVFAIDTNQVFFSDDAGVSWTELTGNLTDINLRTVEYIPTAGGNDIVLVGGNGGVYRMLLNSPGVWTEAGVNLPNAPVWDMDYDAGDNFLVLGTLGRGAWTLANANIVLAPPPVLQICGDEDFANQDDVIRIVRNALNPDLLDIFLNNNTTIPTAQFPLASIEQINVFAAGGNDQLIVDSTNGLIILPGGIRYDGDHGCPGQVGAGIGGFDRLDLVQTGGPTRTNSRVNVGATPGDGQSNIDGQIVDFQFLEPVVDIVPAASFTISSVPGIATLLDKANSINYTPGLLVVGGGRVTVDNFEPIEFLNKTALILDAQAGNDIVNFNNGTIPTGLTTITVNLNDGDDEFTVRDTLQVATLIVNGNAGNDLIDNSGHAGPVGLTSTISGNGGDDIIFGGTGIDTISGNDGDDEIHVDFDGFTDVISGGNGYDRIVISGTPGNDIISAFQSTATQLISTLQSPPAAVASDTDTIGTIEQVDINAGGGNDSIFVQHAEVLEDAAVNGVVFFVDGGTGFTGDRLIAQDNGGGDLLLYRKADSGTEGSITVGPTNAEPLLTDFTNIEYVNPVAAAGGTVVVFKYDPYEYNNDRFNATTLGVGETLNADPVIDPGAIAGLPADFLGPVPQDEDWYRVQALYTGTLDVRLFFRHLANAPANLPGNGDLDLQVTDAAGNVIDFDIDITDNARVRIAAVQGEIYFLHVFGKTAAALNTYDISVANETAPVPFDLELDDALNTGSDTGRSRFDNVTFDTTPTIFVRVADHALLFDGPDNGAAPPAAAFDNVAGELFDIPFQASTATNAPATGFRVAIFDTENNTHDPVPLGYATPVVGRPGVYTFTFNTALTEGSHFISARVEIIDGATTEQAQGFGDFANLSLEIIVDTTAPVAFFGFGPAVGVDGLHPDSDSGYDSQIGTLTDRYTNDLTPTLWGEAEANAVISVFVDVDNDGVITIADRFLGQTVAIPEDGGDQNQFGHWELTSIVSMDDPQLVADLTANGVIAAGQINGPRRFLLAAEDLAGNFSDPADDMNIFIDTQGPQVAAVTVAGTPGYDLFDPKPSTDGPTPAVFALNIDFVDQPIRQNGDPIAIGIHSGLNLQLSLANGNYRLVGDHVGVVNIDAIGNLDVTLDGTIGLTTIQLNFFNALPDDRYTLTISDRIGDDAGNALDGNTNTAEPQENPLFFPSGDGNPGGDFVARFTIDSRPEIGVWATGSVWVDTNGNSEFDPQNTDFTNRDIVYQTGLVTDDVFAGNFVAAAFGVADRFDKLAAYGKVGANFRFSVDTDNDGVGDVFGNSATNPNGAPVSGNFNGFAGDGDEVGVWTGTQWFFDTDHDFTVGDAGNFVLTSALRGYGFTGDFDGDGFVDLATFKDDFFSFDLSSVGATLNANLPGLNGVVDQSFRFGQVGTRERPVAADMNLDGFDDIGLYQPDRTGVAPEEGSEWYWLVSGLGGSVLNRIVFDPIIGALVVNFTPTPFGNDIYQFFGEEFSDPIVGNFDPPVTPVTSSSLNTFGRPYDLDLNGTIDIKDLMYVVYGFNLNESDQYARYADLDRDGTVSIADLLEMVFAYNKELAATANGEGATAANDADIDDGYAAAVDDVLTDDSLFDEQMFALSGDSLGNRKRT